MKDIIVKKDEEKRILNRVNEQCENKIIDMHNQINYLSSETKS